MISSAITWRTDSGGHLVVLADAEIDQRPLGMLGQRLPLGPLDLLELVDLGAFAVLGAADPLGKQLLEIGIAHGSSQIDNES